MSEAIGGGDLDNNRTISNGLEWNDVAAFLAIARHGGLSAAAREIGSSAPTLGRRMRAMERYLNRELFVRRSHGYDLTVDGERLRVELAPAEAVIARATAPSPKGAMPLVRISAGTWTMLALTDHLSKIRGDPPDLRLRLLQGEGVLSIRRREAAIGFRSQRPAKDGLAGRQLRCVAFAPYSTSSAPDRWIVVRADTASARWVAERCGETIAVETDTPRLALDLALKGTGRAMLPTFVGDAHAGLERSGQIIEDLAHEQWLVTHDDDRHLPEIRRAIDRISEVFS